MVSKDQLIGALLILSSRPKAYGPREQAILERLALQMAPAVENAQQLQKNQQLALALESIGDGVAFMDATGHIQFVNRAFTKIFGYELDELQKRHISVIATDSDKIRDLSGVFAQEGSKPGWEGEVRRKRKDGEEIDILLTLTPVRDQDGRLIGRIGINRDITEIKRTEQRLRETARLSSIGQLAAGVAHEINNPLTSVLGFSQLILAEDPPESIREDLEVVFSEASRAARIVHNLLSFARREEPAKV